MTDTMHPSDLALYHRNPRQGDVTVIEGSLRANGQYKPLVVNLGTHTGRPNEVLAGNHTLKAIRNLAEKHPDEERWQQVLVHVVDYDDDRAARVVAVDNRASELGGMDDRLLLELLAELPDLDGTGYDPGDLAELEKALAEDDPLPEPEADPDDAPEPPAEPVSKLGDVWLLGPHRVMCGDSTDSDVASKVMGGVSADMVWTDPPYGVAYVGGNHGIYSPEARKAAGGLTIQNDELTPEKLHEFIYEAFATAITVCKPGAPVYVAAPAGPLHNKFGDALEALSIWRQTITWVKDVFVMGRSHFHYRHEPIFYGWLPGAACLHPPADRNHDTVWEVPRPKRSTEHPTMKPVELVTKAINISSDRGDVIYEPFGGSGTTLISAHLTGRKARVIELDPKYVDVICRRFQQVSGTMPVLESTREPHDFTAGVEAVSA